MSFENELEVFSKEIGNQITGYQGRVMTILSESEKKCIKDSGTNADKFVDCMLKTSKKLAKQQKMLEFRLAFFQQETFNCFSEQSKAAKNYAECKQSSKKKLDDYFKRFIDSL